MFTPVQDVRVRGQVGLGLGLNIVKSLVEMDAGKVSVFIDGPGHGAKCFVQLPRAECQSPMVFQSQLEETADTVPEGRRVLIVDDNKDAARTLALVLSIRECVCRSAFNCQTALALADEFDPYVVVLDLGMPGMTGRDMARHLRSLLRFQNTLLIAVTGWDKEDDIRESRTAGFDHHLAKPANVKTLHKLIQGFVPAACGEVPSHVNTQHT